MNTETTAIIGLDGLSPTDADEFDILGEWDPLDIETTRHTCPSWNAIFSGKEREGVYDFFQVPDAADTLSGELASHSQTMWTYEDLRTQDYLWERHDVDVVSAPVVLPTFTTLENPPGLDLTWCTERDEMARSIERLTELTLAQDRVITVFPFPDKMHHMVDAADSPYTTADRMTQMSSLADAVETLTDAFDEWVLLSDHGRPAEREPIPPGDLWVASHDPTGVIQSNSINTAGLTNVSVYDELDAFLAGA